MKFAWAIIFFLTSVASANDVRWELRVNQANYDVQAHTLDDNEYKPLLVRTSWRCWAERPTKNNNLSIRALRCNYSLEPSGEFRTYISCGPGKNVDEAAVELKDERKNLDLKVVLLCQYESGDKT